MTTDEHLFRRSNPLKICLCIKLNDAQQFEATIEDVSHIGACIRRMKNIGPVRMCAMLVHIGRNTPQAAPLTSSEPAKTSNIDYLFRNLPMPLSVQCFQQEQERHVREMAEQRRAMRTAQQESAGREQRIVQLEQESAGRKQSIAQQQQEATIHKERIAQLEQEAKAQSEQDRAALVCRYTH